MRDFPTGETLEQMALSDESKGDRFRAEADAWIDDNPEAWSYMLHMARLSAERHRRFGIGALCEHVRWEMLAKGVDSFKLNNNYRSHFARRLIKEVPECEPYIATRSAVVDE